MCQILLFVIFFLSFDFISSSKRPNIILIVADDLGWGDVSLHGSKQIATPNIDALASDGIILNNYYVQPLCTPSRSALLSGYHPIHTGMQHFVLRMSEPRGFPLQHQLLPQYLRNNLNYSTHMLGKWHLGHYKRDYTPTQRGFDSFLGYWAANEDYYDRTKTEPPNMWGIDFHRGESGEDINKPEYSRVYSTEMYTREAEKIIANHSNCKSTCDNQNPMFLYLSHQAVHFGNLYNILQVPEKYTARFEHIKYSQRRRLAAMISALDDSVGRIVSSLYAHNMINNTIIIFTTDNGGACGMNHGFSVTNSSASNTPLRGCKSTLWEGGIRGNGFIWSAGLKKRYVSDHLMHVSDWLPTVYAAAGGNIEDIDKSSLNVPIDGINLWDSIITNASFSPRKNILHNIDMDNHNDIVFSVRSGDYKLIQAREFKWWKPPGEGKEIISSKCIKNWCPDALKSPVAKVLHSIGRKLKQIKYVKVNCGNKNEKIKLNECLKSPCLFDIKEDPCEYENIAEKFPEIVKKLTELYLIYNATAIPPSNMPSDPQANPTLHNYRWVSWM